MNSSLKMQFSDMMESHTHLLELNATIPFKIEPYPTLLSCIFLLQKVKTLLVWISTLKLIYFTTKVFKNMMHILAVNDQLKN